MTSRLLKDDSFSDLTVTRNFNLIGNMVASKSSSVTLIDTLTTIISNTNSTISLGFDVGGAPVSQTILATSQTANRTIILPDIDGTVVVTAGAQTIGGTKTFSSALVSPLTAGYTYSGTLTASGATTVVALNSRVGTVTITGVGDIAASATANAVFNNSLVTASTVGSVTLNVTTAAAGSTPRIETVTYGAGTITIAIRNSAAATATGAGANYTFSFILFN